MVGGLDIYYEDRNVVEDNKTKRNISDLRCSLDKFFKGRSRLAERNKVLLKYRRILYEIEKKYEDKLSFRDFILLNKVLVETTDVIEEYTRSLYVLYSKRRSACFHKQRNEELNFISLQAAALKREGLAVFKREIKCVAPEDEPLSGIDISTMSKSGQVDSPDPIDTDHPISSTELTDATSQIDAVEPTDVVERTDTGEPKSRLLVDPDILTMNMIEHIEDTEIYKEKLREIGLAHYIDREPIKHEDSLESDRTEDIAGSEDDGFEMSEEDRERITKLKINLKIRLWLEHFVNSSFKLKEILKKRMKDGADLSKFEGFFKYLTDVVDCLGRLDVTRDLDKDEVTRLTDLLNLFCQQQIGGVLNFEYFGYRRNLLKCLQEGLVIFSSMVYQLFDKSKSSEEIERILDENIFSFRLRCPFEQIFCSSEVEARFETVDEEEIKDKILYSDFLLCNPDACESKTKVISPSDIKYINFLDLQQGDRNDCWFNCAIYSLLSANPNLINEIIKFDKEGKFAYVRLFVPRRLSNEDVIRKLKDENTYRGAFGNFIQYDTKEVYVKIPCVVENKTKYPLWFSLLQTAFVLLFQKEGTEIDYGILNGNGENFALLSFYGMCYLLKGEREKVDLNFNETNKGKQSVPFDPDLKLFVEELLLSLRKGSKRVYMEDVIKELRKENYTNVDGDVKPMPILRKNPLDGSDIPPEDCDSNMNPIQIKARIDLFSKYSSVFLKSGISVYFPFIYKKFSGNYTPGELELYEEIKESISKGSAMCSFNDSAKKKFVPNHAFSIIGVEEIGNLKFIILRNPWRKEGVLYSRDHERFRSKRKEMPENMGIFKVELNHFIKHFCLLYKFFEMPVKKG